MSTSIQVGVVVLAALSSLIGALTTVAVNRRHERRTKTKVWRTLHDQSVYVVAKDEYAAGYYAREQNLQNWRYVRDAAYLRGRVLRTDQILYTPEWRRRPDADELAETIIFVATLAPKES